MFVHSVLPCVRMVNKNRYRISPHRRDRPTRGIHNLRFTPSQRRKPLQYPRCSGVRVYIKTTQYNYEIVDTPDSLVINWKRSKDWLLGALYLAGLFFVLVFLSFFTNLAIREISQGDLSPSSLFTIILISAWIIYLTGFYQGILSAIEQFLDREIISIFADRIIIEKYSRAGRHFIRELLLDDRTIFFVLYDRAFDQTMLSINRSRFLVKLCRSGIYTPFFFRIPAPFFCRNISYYDSLEILKRIKSRFHDFNIVHYSEGRAFGGI